MTLPVLALIMLLLYRGVTPALLSTVVAGATVVLTYGVLSVVVRFVELSVFVQNAATMLGLGVAVDYSLFINSRFREERARGARPAVALATTMRTAGLTVISSGATVTLAMATLFVVDLPVIRSLAIGAVTAVVVAVLVNVLLLPALLMLVARRPSYSRTPTPGRHAAVHISTVKRATETVMRRPVLALLCGLGLLLALAVPAAPAVHLHPRRQDRARRQHGAHRVRPGARTVRHRRRVTGCRGGQCAMFRWPKAPPRQQLSNLPARLAGLDNVAAANSAIPVLATAAPSAPLSAVERRSGRRCGPGRRADRRSLPVRPTGEPWWWN